MHSVKVKKINFRRESKRMLLHIITVLAMLQPCRLHPSSTGIAQYVRISNLLLHFRKNLLAEVLFRFPQEKLLHS